MLEKLKERSLSIGISCIKSFSFYETRQYDQLQKGRIDKSFKNVVETFHGATVVIST